MAYNAGYNAIDIQWSKEVPDEKKRPLQHCGLDFVFLEYRLIVRGSADSILVFDSSKPHGTTPAVGVGNFALAATASKQVVESYKAKLAAGGFPNGGELPDRVVEPLDDGSVF